MSVKSTKSSFVDVSLSYENAVKCRFYIHFKIIALACSALNDVFRFVKPRKGSPIQDTDDEDMIVYGMEEQTETPKEKYDKYFL
ncbi:hypothetical protein TNCV_3795891 [Trichonephila clavipes]|nr:hypothetical protein TNCV_3795891 [Trichonephila clavipes]